MKTIRIHKSGVQMIAHRGASGLELQNTCAAFVAAGNRSYFGIETDVHVTADGKYILIHDDSTGHVAEESISVKNSTFETLRALPLRQSNGATRIDLRMPSLEEYLSICSHYGKKAVLELKNSMEKAHISEIVKLCKQICGLENVIFISFTFQNLVYVKECEPTANGQYLLFKNIDLLVRTDLVEKMKALQVDVDIEHPALTPEHVSYLHRNGLKVNCWTVDDPYRAEELISWGVDYITSNILE